MRWCAPQYCAERLPQGRNAPVQTSALPEPSIVEPELQEPTWESEALLQVTGPLPFSIAVHAATADQQDGGQVESTGRVHGYDERSPWQAFCVHIT